MEQRPDRDEHRDHESDEERLDRELLELLNEVRVAMPGVQVLFGFLLAVPFQQRFAMTTAFQRDVYFATLLCSAAATAFLVMPVAYHRIMFRQRDKPRIVLQGARSIIAGLAFLALAMSGAVLLVTDVIFGDVTTVVATAVSGCCSRGCGSATHRCAARWASAPGASRSSTSTARSSTPTTSTRSPGTGPSAQHDVVAAGLAASIAHIGMGGDQLVARARRRRRGGARTATTSARPRRPLYIGADRGGRAVRRARAS